MNGLPTEKSIERLLRVTYVRVCPNPLGPSELYCFQLWSMVHYRANILKSNIETVWKVCMKYPLMFKMILTNDVHKICDQHKTFLNEMSPTFIKLKGSWYIISRKIRSWTSYLISTWLSKCRSWTPSFSNLHLQSTAKLTSRGSVENQKKIGLATPFLRAKMIIFSVKRLQGALFFVSCNASQLL